MRSGIPLDAVTLEAALPRSARFRPAKRAGGPRRVQNYLDQLQAVRLPAVSILVILLAGLAGCVSTRDPNRTTFQTVVIDAGHGGHDSGAVARGVLPEKIWTLQTALALQQELQQAGFRTVLTRSNDTFISLDRRVYLSAAQPKAIFVSIHFNYANRRAAEGLETYYRTPLSIELARVVHRAVLAIPGLADRGVRTANFHVIRVNPHPAILIEGGYLTNPRDAARIQSPGFSNLLAHQISRGILTYRGSSPRATASAGPEPGG